MSQYRPDAPRWKAKGDSAQKNSESSVVDSSQGPQLLKRDGNASEERGDERPSGGGGRGHRPYRGGRGGYSDRHYQPREERQILRPSARDQPGAAQAVAPAPSADATAAEARPLTDIEIQRKKAEEDRIKREEERRKAEQVRLEERRKRDAEEFKRRDEQRRRDDEKKRREEDIRHQREADRKRRDEEERRRKEEAERKRKEEEERQRLEAELAKQKEEEERLRKEAEERARKEAEELRLLLEAEAEQKARDDEARRLAEERRTLLLQNLAAIKTKPNAATVKGLDTNIKRNSTFVKKLGAISEDKRESLCSELQQLNLSKYISEAVTSIADAKLKLSDIGAAVKICSLLHQRYAEFASLLVPALTALFAPPPRQPPGVVLGIAAAESEQERTQKFQKRRINIRLLAELFLCGMYQESEILYTILKDLIAQDQYTARDNKDIVYHNLSLVVSFVKTVAEDMLGIKTQRAVPADVEKPPALISPAQQQAFVGVLNIYYEDVCKYLISEHKALRAMERENHTILETKGELPEQNVANYDRMRKVYERLVTTLGTLADLLGKSLPSLPEDPATTRIEAVTATSGVVVKDTAALSEPLFDDEETRSFYEDLPDLRAVLPGVLFGDAQPKGEQGPAEEKKDDKDGKEEPKAAVDAKTDAKADAKSEESAAKDDKATTDADKAKKSEADKSGKEAEKPAKEGEKKKEDEDRDVGPPSSKLELLIQRLPNCINRDLMDAACMDFCTMNSKANRRRLVKALFNVPRTQLSLIPHYARMIAIIFQYWKDVQPVIVGLLEEEFTYHLHKKDQINIETRIRNVRFVAELTKFKVFPPSLTLSMYSQCLDDFAHHNVDVACNLLETCGRFLYRSPETHVRTKNLLDKMMRLKNAQNMQHRIDNMIENAYFYCVPPERKAAKPAKVYEPMQAYIRHLVYVELSRATLKNVLKQLRKLPWAKQEAFLFKTLFKVHKGKYSNIQLIASLVAGLSSYHDVLALRYVDAVLEQVRSGLEVNDFGMLQRQIMNIRLLGELYNYCVIESPVVFDTLYMLLTFGHDEREYHDPTPFSIYPAPTDPLTDCFRIRLVVTLLDSCGQYFDRGSAKKKLDRFLVFLQRYVLSKSNVPMDVDFMLQDMFENLRPQLALMTSFEEACEAARKIEAEEQALAPAAAAAEPEAEAEESESESDSEESEDDEEDEEDDGDDTKESEESDSESAEESEEDGVYDRNQVFVPTIADTEFDREFNKIMQESMEARKYESRPRNTILEMSIPMNLLRKAQPAEEEAEAHADERPEDTVQVRLLVKKGNKPAMRNLDVPKDSNLVARAQAAEKEREDLEEMKRFVLNYEEREEEENLIALGYRPQPVNFRGGRGQPRGGGGPGRGNRPRGTLWQFSTGMQRSYK
eukprot:TRINITY_DN10128_c0_g1_i1.p1 TRINITY_DN10128_c0_g1~~TRINITY_DN10128_c0_g1_i1.p1  ORF type:complete len:1390 (-),score=694.08 TRINITY_DN10128_c0_g1_i1:248-4417(-)